MIPLPEMAEDELSIREFVTAQQLRKNSMHIISKKAEELINMGVLIEPGKDALCGAHAKDALRYGLVHTQPTRNVKPMAFSFEFDKIEKQVWERVMNGSKESKREKAARELAEAKQRKAEKKEADRKRYCSWEFGVAHPEMLNLREIAKSVTRETPFAVVENFRKEKYTKVVKCKKGERTIESERSVPVCEQVTILIHETLILKAKIIEHDLIYAVENMDELDQVEGMPAFFATIPKKKVDHIVKLARDVKSASFDDGTDKQFVRVMLRKI